MLALFVPLHTHADVQPAPVVFGTTVVGRKVLETGFTYNTNVRVWDDHDETALGTPLAPLECKGTDQRLAMIHSSPSLSVSYEMD